MPATLSSPRNVVRYTVIRQRAERLELVGGVRVLGQIADVFLGMILMKNLRFSRCVAHYVSLAMPSSANTLFEHRIGKLVIAPTTC
jgi:hypothetical protein